MKKLNRFFSVTIVVAQASEKISSSHLLNEQTQKSSMVKSNFPGSFDHFKEIKILFKNLTGNFIVSSFTKKHV